MPLKVKNILIKNTGIQILSQAFSLSLALATAALLSRYLGVAGYGQFNYLFAFFYFFLIFNDFGVDTAVVREVSQKPALADSIFGSMLCFKLMMSVALTVLAWGMILLMKFEEPMRSSLLLFAFILPLQGLQTPSLIFQVNLKMEYPAFVGLINKAIQFSLLFMAIQAEWTLRGITLMLVASELTAMLMLTFFYRRFVKPHFRPDFELWKKILKSSIPIGVTSLFAAVINRIDFLMLERMTDMHQVGLYAATYKIANTFESLPLLMMATLYPVMARFAAEDKSRLRSVYNKGNLLFAAIGIPCGLVISYLSPWIIRILFGTDFVQAAQGLSILIWASVFVYLALNAGTVLISMGREKINLVINAAAALLNILLNLWLIPIRGYVGASIATVAAYAFVFIALRVSARIVLNKKMKETP
jgi:O-antigen/teichoic acid export membrane protein